MTVALLCSWNSRYTCKKAKMQGVPQPAQHSKPQARNSACWLSSMLKVASCDASKPFNDLCIFSFPGQGGQAITHVIAQPAQPRAWGSAKASVAIASEEPATPVTLECGMCVTLKQPRGCNHVESCKIADLHTTLCCCICMPGFHVV